jgi:hypothetical protein
VLDVTKGFDVLKLTPLPLLGIALATGLVLFLPESAARTLGAQEWRVEYRAWLGGGFILSSVLFALHVVAATWKGITRWWSSRRVARARLRSLRTLTSDEIAFLRAYFRESTATQYGSMANGVISGLEARRIIYRSSNMLQPYGYGEVAYNLQPWAREALLAHPEWISDDDAPPP